MKKIFKIVGIVIAVIVLIGGISAGILIKKTIDAVDNQENVDIDMDMVNDGVYTGEGDGGIVQVKVEVTVVNHKITKIDIVEHKNGKGKPAEAMIDKMILENTDDVDTVSGATMSSKTIRNAVNTALRKGVE